MATITKEKIIETAEKLTAEGKNPTQVTVREALGGGSFATIGPVLKAWKDSQKEDHALAEIEVPATISERLEQLQGAVWQAAVDEAERRLTAEREALKVAQEAAAAEVAEQLESVQALEAEAEDYQKKIETLEETSKALDIDRHNALSKLATVKEKAMADQRARAEAIIKEVERREAAEGRAERAEALHREATEQARSDLAALRSEHKAELAKMKKEVSEQVQVAELQAQEQAKRAERAEKEAQQRAVGEQACQSRLEASQREIEQMRNRVVTLEGKAEKAVQEAAELRGEIKAMRDVQEAKNGD